MQSTTLSDDDRLLVDALQVAPRAPWSAIGSVLGISAITASRRWQHLVDEGLAWVTAAPGMAQSSAQCLAYVEITCRPAERMAVANALAQHQLVMTVELTIGSADILATIAASDLTKMSHYLLEHLSEVPGLLSTRARLATRIYSEGSAWRVRELPADAVTTLSRIRDEQTTGPAPKAPMAPSDNLHTMLTHLALDGRASYAELAERSNISPTTARRYLAWLIRSRIVNLRTDVCAPAVGWPVQLYLWANSPVDTLNETAHTLSSFRQARLCAIVTAGPSLALCSWLHTVEDVHRLELGIAHRLPQVEIVDRLVVVRQVKRMGRLLDESGCAVGVVPINLWDDLLH